MLGAVLFGHQEMKAVIEACNELKEKAGNEIWNIEVPEDQNNYYQELESNYKSQISEAFKISIKSDRNDALREIRNQIQEQHEDLDEMEIMDHVSAAINNYEPRAIMRSLQAKARPDNNSIELIIRFQIINTFENVELNVELTRLR